MEKLQNLLEECLSRQLARIIISNRRKANIAQKIVVKPFAEKNRLFFQFAKYQDKQVFHTNLEKKQAGKHIIELLEQKYKQMEISMSDYSYRCKSDSFRSVLPA